MFRVSAGSWESQLVQPQPMAQGIAPPQLHPLPTIKAPGCIPAPSFPFLGIPACCEYYVILFILTGQCVVSSLLTYKEIPG